MIAGGGEPGGGGGGGVSVLLSVLMPQFPAVGSIAFPDGV